MMAERDAADALDLQSTVKRSRAQKCARGDFKAIARALRSMAGVGEGFGCD